MPVSYTHLQDEQRQRKVDKRVDHWENQGPNPGPSNKDERQYMYDNCLLYTSGIYKVIYKLI